MSSWFWGFKDSSDKPKRTRIKIDHRAHEVDWGLDEVLREFLDDGVIKVISSDKFYKTLQSGEITIKFWVANKFYAYAQQGEIFNNGARIYTWNDQMPSNETIEDLFNIHNNSEVVEVVKNHQIKGKDLEAVQTLFNSSEADMGQDK